MLRRTAGLAGICRHAVVTDAPKRATAGIPEFIEQRQAPSRQNKTGAQGGAGGTLGNQIAYELAFNTVTARRFCDQQEMSLQTATGRSLP